MQLTSSFERETYNALLDVAQADENLIARGREAAVARLLSIICRHGLENVLGIRLLHRHNTLNEGEFMIEQGVVDADGLALVTSACVATESSPLIANSWKWTSRGFIPLEFSAPELLCENAASTHVGLPVFAELARELEALNLSDLVGPALHYGSLVEGYRPASDFLLLEATDFQQRANVLRFVSSDHSLRIQKRETKWSARLEFPTGGGGLPTLLTACSCACSVFPEGGHQGTHIHFGKKKEESPPTEEGTKKESTD